MLGRTESPPAIWPPASLRAFSTAGHDILVLARQIPDFRSLAELATLGHFRTQATRSNLAAQVSEGMEFLGFRDEAFAEDVMETTDRFLAAFDLEEASLRMEAVDEASCPRFHVDTVHVRLVTTYFGPSTECIETAHPGRIYATPPGSLVFLKGRRHPTWSNAILHRSPQVEPGTKRLCVAIDF